MTTLKVVATHAVLYLATYFVLDFVEDHLTSSGAVALTILGLSIPLSFLANLWAAGGFAEYSRGRAVRAALITAGISPFSLMVWLTLYLRMVGYEHKASDLTPTTQLLNRRSTIVLLAQE